MSALPSRRVRFGMQRAYMRNSISGRSHPRDALRRERGGPNRMFDAGVIIAEGPPKKIFTRANHERTRRFLNQLQWERARPWSPARRTPAQALELSRSHR